MVHISTVWPETLLRQEAKPRVVGNPGPIQTILGAVAAWECGVTANQRFKTITWIFSTKRDLTHGLWKSFELSTAVKRERICY